ncbi:hypothetical protein [Nocardioides sp. J54]|uniref:hypothetical protein n=1 Tax=Nocardioides sp. J54 TaxID=935866 RepID=UPI0004903EF4|nr:hypothetical protein [Nocardioides sp. J54]
MTPDSPVRRVRRRATLRHLVVAPALAVALLATTGGVASAQTWRHDDAVRDVRSGDFDSEWGTLSPQRKAGDVTRTTVSHTRSRLVVRIAMRAVPSGSSFVMATVRTPRTSYDVTRFRMAGIGTTVVLEKTNGAGGELRCRGLSARVRGKALELSVPRRCIGKPAWVRVAAGVVVLQGEDAVHVDDALRRGVGRDLRLSPRVRRG